MYPKRQDYLRDNWFFAGAIMLSAIAGFTNSATFHLSGFAASHLTGSITRVSIEFAQRDYHDLRPFAVIVVTFFLGAAVSGAVVADKELGVGRRYAVMLGVEGFLLILAGHLATQSTSQWALGIATFACGLQNALATSFRGMMVRTTHMTGTMTDLGFLFGKFLRTGKADLKPLSLLVMTFLGFMAGGVGGAIAAMWYEARAFQIAGLAALVCGGVYAVLRTRAPK